MSNEKDFLPGCLFSLEGFEQTSLFDLNKPVYEALGLLEELDWTGKISIEIPDNVTIVHRHLVTIEKGVTIAPYAYIEGPCYIGKGCRIGHAAYIRPFTILSSCSVVGHASEVKSSIFFPGAKAPHFCYVGDSILGRDVNLGAGTVCANFRFDEKPIALRRGGQKLLTNRRKLGAVLGDFAKTGCNVVLQPGTILEKHAIKLGTDQK